MTDNSSNNKRIAKNSIFMSIRMVIVLLITLYTTRVILEILGIVDYGVYNVVCGFVSMFAFLNTSMSNGIQRFFNFEFGKNGEQGANRVYNTALVIQFILTILIVLIAETFGTWYLHNRMVIPEERAFAAECIFQLSVLSFIFIIMQAPFSAAIMAHERLDFYAVVSVIDAVLKLCIVLAIPYFPGDKLIVYGVLFALINVLNFVLYSIYCKRNFAEIKIRNFFDKTLFLSMLGFSGWNVFGSLSGVMKEQGINLVINVFFGPVVNAARAVATQVNSGLQAFVANVTVPVRPQVTQSYAKGDIERTLSLTFTISKLSCVFLYLMALPISWEIDYVLSFWLGDNVPEHASSFVIIVMATSLLNNLNSAISGVVHATGKMKLYQLSTSFTAMAAVPLAFVVLKLGYSPEWALAMVSLTMIAAQTVAVVVLSKLIVFSLKEYWEKVISPLLILFVSTFWIPSIVVYYIPMCFIRVLVTMIISSLFVMIIFYKVGLQDNESFFIKTMFNKLKIKL